ncbi:MAG: SH3 domain-containing protein [Chloroflexi bacterium]|nr:SH3 domain-containing protein [Chloroflexota bacterium]
MSVFRKIISILSLAVLLQGCLFRPQAADNGRQTVDSESPTATADIPSPAIQDSTPLASPPPTLAPTAVVILPTPLPSVTITAATGNIFIRRGPGLPYNPIGVLSKGASARVIAQDVLSDWVQINIPDSETTGWVSIQTMYSKVDGDLSQLPDFTFTDWPLPAYIKNCTEHDMFIAPGEIYLSSLYTNAQYKNEVQVNPGSYVAYDLFVPGEPEAQEIEIREGVTAYITINGLGEEHKCP